MIFVNMTTSTDHLRSVFACEVERLHATLLNKFLCLITFVLSQRLTTISQQKPKQKKSRNKSNK